MMSPYDEYAVEEAIRIKEKKGGETVVVCVGPDRAVESMRTALAMGMDRGVHCGDAAFAGSDALATAKILAAVIKKENPDLVLCGRQAIDFDQAQVPGLSSPNCSDCPRSIRRPKSTSRTARPWSTAGSKAARRLWRPRSRP